MTAANPEKKKMVYKKIVHWYAIYNFSQIMSLPSIHNAHHCYSQELHEGGRVKKSKKVGRSSFRSSMRSQFTRNQIVLR